MSFQPPELLVVGSASLADQVSRALPAARVAHSTAAEDSARGNGLVQAVLLSLEKLTDVAACIREVRAAHPAARVVVSTGTHSEPAAKAALMEGADDYVLEPLEAAELSVALGVASSGGPAEDRPERPGADSFDWARALTGLAELMEQSLGATGCAIEYLEQRGATAKFRKAAIEEKLRHEGREVGRILAGRKRRGAYDASGLEALKRQAVWIASLLSQCAAAGRWRELAWTDCLSGLRNRRFCEESLGALVQRCATQRRALTLLLFDIDNFKSYNDELGHEAGDELIREIGTLLRRCTRQEDIVARYGGDEFMVIFQESSEPRVPGSRHPGEAMVMAERFCKALQRHTFRFLSRSGPAPVTISGGLATFPWDAASVSELLRAADQALLEAKRTGKNVLRFGPRHGAGERPASARE